MGRFDLKALQTRTFSALILGPVFLAVVWYGGLFFLFTLLLIAALSVYEWYGLVKQNRFWPAYLLAGFIYIGVGFYSFYMCRVLGVEHIVLLLLMVWSSDTGAYFFGKSIGGPKLLETVSPNKTWAGLWGAVLCPVVILFSFFFIFDKTGIQEFWPSYLLLSGVAGIFVGLLGQAGDLFMSYMKRRAFLKDTGDLIPGHGGVLDRIDSLLLVTPAFYLLWNWAIAIVTIT